MGLLKGAGVPDLAFKKRVEDYYRPRILKALAEHITGYEEAVRTALSTPTKSSSSDRARARAAADQFIKADPTALARELRGLYNDAAARGVGYAIEEMNNGGVKLGVNLAQFAQGTDWANWTPGSVSIADVAGPRIAATLKNTESLASSIANTTLDRIATQIANGIALGSKWQDVSQSISALIEDPLRADVIAITETNRAYNEATLDSYASGGIDGWTWVAYDGACDECSELDGNQFTLDDDPPPAHPDCRCGVEPVLPDSTE